MSKVDEKAFAKMISDSMANPMVAENWRQVIETYESSKVAEQPVELIDAMCAILYTATHARKPWEHEIHPDYRKRMREAVRKALQLLLPNLEYDAHLDGCPLYNEEETTLMRNAYERAKERGAYTEALYAVASAILRHRGHLPLITEEKVYVGCCVVCSKTTEYACANCKIDTRKTVYVCGKKECREKHESTFCTRNVTKLMQSDEIEGKKS